MGTTGRVVTIETALSPNEALCYPLSANPPPGKYLTAWVIIIIIFTIFIVILFSSYFHEAGNLNDSIENSF